MLLRAGVGDGGCRNREEVFGLGISSAVQSFPKESSDSQRWKHRVWSKARDGMISMAFAFQIHQSSSEGSDSIQIFKYFFLFHVESSYHCRKLQKSAEIRI